MKIDSFIAEVVALKRQMEQIDARRRELEQKIMSMLESTGSSALEWKADDGSTGRVSVVRSSEIVYDDAGIKAGVTPAVWRSITKPVIDSKALEDRIARGIVPIELVAENSYEKPRKPYLRITHK